MNNTRAKLTVAMALTTATVIRQTGEHITITIRAIPCVAVQSGQQRALL
ncbi:hypothetical protein [Bradyrhizobium sp. DOA9]|nr:hypothetical protein [Bradyrhizobium sp. DOA9]